MWQQYIDINPKILVGKPIIKGTRLSVEFIIDLFAQGWTNQQVLENYPNITQEDILACFSYAGHTLQQEKIYPILQVTK